MINREERQARIKLQIAKAISEIDHGDSAAAVLALADGLNAMLHYVESGEEALAARLEAIQIKLNERAAKVHPMSEEMKEAAPQSGSGRTPALIITEGLTPGGRVAPETKTTVVMGEEVKEAAPPARIKVTKR